MSLKKHAEDNKLNSIEKIILDKMKPTNLFLICPNNKEVVLQELSIQSEMTKDSQSTIQYPISVQMTFIKSEGVFDFLSSIFGGQKTKSVSIKKYTSKQLNVAKTVVGLINLKECFDIKITYIHQSTSYIIVSFFCHFVEDKTAEKVYTVISSYKNNFHLS